MRLWRDDKGALLTDEQLLRHISCFGGLSAALAHGDVVLVSEDTDSTPARSRHGRRSKAARLADYLGGCGAASV